MNNSPDVIHLFVCQFWRILKMNYPSAAIADFRPRAFPEGEGWGSKKKTPDLRLRYVPPQRVGFLGLFGLKIARTQTLFYFSFRSFQKIGECWWSINIPWFLFWRENRGSVNRLVWKRCFAHFSLKLGMVFKGTTGAYECMLLFQFQMNENKIETPVCKFKMHLNNFFVCTLI